MHYISLSLLIFTIQIYLAGVFSEEQEKHFVVVSSYEWSGLDFAEIRSTKPQSLSMLSKNVRKQICQDIISTRFFRLRKECPVEAKNFCCIDHDWFMKDTWPYDKIKVKYNVGDDEQMDENVFLCESRNTGSGGTILNQISDEYNLNTIQPNLPHLYMPGRFTFMAYNEEWLMDAVAEVPGKAHFSPDLNIENVYLQRRESQHQKDATLCKYREENLRRICVAVFKSEYFADRVSYRQAGQTVCDCEEQDVSFQTVEFEGRDTTITGFKEWMLDCKASRAYEGVKFEYLLSYAYELNQIFVYYRHRETGEVFPENLTFNVRLSLTPSPKKSSKTSLRRTNKSEATISEKLIKFSPNYLLSHCIFFHMWLLTS